MDIPGELHLKRYRRIVFFTGAGLSAESGIPTYRGKDGIWKNYDYEEFACQRAFDTNPEKVWDFHDERRRFVAKCQPSPGHRIIAAVERELPFTTVVTQNIDGLHQKAGSKNVIELHGSLWRVRCDQEHKVFLNEDVPLRSRRCQCGEYLRPDIVWFEDALKEEQIMNALQTISACDILLSIGTSGYVFPAAQLPLYAMKQGIPCVEINLEKTPLSGLYTYHLQGSAQETLAKLWS